MMEYLLTAFKSLLGLKMGIFDLHFAMRLQLLKVMFTMFYNS